MSLRAVVAKTGRHSTHLEMLYAASDATEGLVAEHPKCHLESLSAVLERMHCMHAYLCAFWAEQVAD